MEDTTTLVVVAGILGGVFAVMQAVLKFAGKVIHDKRNSGKENPTVPTDMGTYARRDGILELLDNRVQDVHRIVCEPVPNKAGQYLVWRPESKELKDEIRLLARSIDALSSIVGETRGLHMQVLDAVLDLKTG